MMIMTDEKIIQVAKDHVQDWCLNHNDQVYRSDIYLIEFKSDELREDFKMKLGIRGYTDVFIFKANILKNNIVFSHTDPGNYMYVGLGR